MLHGVMDATDDHGYVSTSRISYNEWKTQPSRINFDILKFCQISSPAVWTLGDYFRWEDIQNFSTKQDFHQ